MRAYRLFSIRCKCKFREAREIKNTGNNPLAYYSYSPNDAAGSLWSLHCVSKYADLFAFEPPRELGRSTRVDLFKCLSLIYTKIIYTERHGRLPRLEVPKQSKMSHKPSHRDNFFGEFDSNYPKFEFSCCQVKWSFYFQAWFLTGLTLVGKVTNKLFTLILIKMAERSEAKSAKRSFASKVET